MIAVYLVECLPGIGLMILLWLRFQRKSLALDLAVLAGSDFAAVQGQDKADKQRRKTAERSGFPYN